jgi:muramoyltetrapeptide carboxypeptidase LdcA involved in peptidoglycan recycling
MENKKNLCIGIYSPSIAITAIVPERFKRGVEYLEGKGFKIKQGILTGKKDHYRSGTIKDRVLELNTLIRDDEVDIIMSTTGGTNSNSLLPYIDFEYLKKHPKIFIGYSDVTAILLAVYAKTGIVPLYGPAFVASFGEFPPLVDETYEYFMNIVGESCKTPYTLPTPEYWTDEFLDWKTQKRAKTLRANKLITVNEGKVRGRLMGGNLNTIQGIWGSEYMPEIKRGDILFIEDSLKDAATVERSFSMLKVNGVFDKVSGIILGKHELFKDMNTGRKPYEILLEVLNGQKIPFLADFDCSHTHPMLTLPIGKEVELDTVNQTVTVL